MAVIKGVITERLLRDAVVLDMGDLARQADQLVAAGRREAAEIVEDAKAEARRLIDQAQEIGYGQGFERGSKEGRDVGQREGRAQALAEASEQLQALSVGWEHALQQWESQREELFRRATEDVIRLALALGERVTRRVIAAEPECVRDQLAAAMGMLSRPTAVEIVIHPADRPFVEEALPSILARASSCRHASVRDDQAVERGGCVVATAAGHVDATIETQFDRIAEMLVPDRQSSASSSFSAPRTPAPPPSAPTPTAPTPDAPSASAPAPPSDGAP